MTFKVVNATGMRRTIENTRMDSLLLWKVDLETDDIAILNLTLTKWKFGLHELNHAWFDFLFAVRPRPKVRLFRGWLTSYNLSGVLSVQRILSFITGTRSPTLLAWAMYTLPTPKMDCFEVSKCLRKIIIDWGGSGWSWSYEQLKIDHMNWIFELPWKGWWWLRDRVSNHFVLPPYHFVSSQQLRQKLEIGIKQCELWRTQRWLVLWDVGIWTDCFVYTVHKHPQADLILRVIEMLGNALLECTVILLLQHSEGGQVRRELVEVGQVKPLMIGKCIIGDHLK